MNLGIRRKDLSTNNNRATKAIGAMPITGILLAAAALLSGFSSVIGSETAIAQQQQNVTGTNAATAANVTAANATTGANVTGNQTGASNNQTGAAADTSGGSSSNNAVTAGSYYP